MAQFLGADVASLLSPLGTFIALVVCAWVFGFAWAWLYNRLAG